MKQNTINTEDDENIQYQYMPDNRLKEIKQILIYVPKEVKENTTNEINR